jgi:hypothetical protein
LKDAKLKELQSHTTIRQNIEQAIDNQCSFLIELIESRRNTMKIEIQQMQQLREQHLITALQKIDELLNCLPTLIEAATETTSSESNSKETQDQLGSAKMVSTAADNSIQHSSIRHQRDQIDLVRKETDLLEAINYADEFYHQKDDENLLEDFSWTWVPDCCPAIQMIKTGLGKIIVKKASIPHFIKKPVSRNLEIEENDFNGNTMEEVD